MRKVDARTALLQTTARGLVVYNARIELAPSFQRHRFATLLYRAEQELYRRWSVREIPLHAAGAGALVWRKEPFGFLPQWPAPLKARYSQWASLNLRRPPCPTNPADYPQSFLAEMIELQL